MELVCHKKFEELPKSDKIITFVIESRKYLFPGYFEPCDRTLDQYLESKLNNIRAMFLEHVKSDKNACEQYICELQKVREILKSDIEFTFDSDPACENYDEVILTYPGLFAISYYRIAHILYDLKIPVVPRIISEYAHSRTGIDIHPGAQIGDHFFIDHGTGIVIGETSVIGHHVKIYHGVTLGALSLSAGQSLRGQKRHPTVGNFVTIYAGASILGGKTMIGDHVTIGSNVFLVDSVLPNSKVLMNNKI